MRLLILAIVCGCQTTQEVSVEVTGPCSSIKARYRSTYMPRSLERPACLDEYCLSAVPAREAVEAEDDFDHEPPSVSDEESIWLMLEADADRWAARHETTP